MVKDTGKMASPGAIQPLNMPRLVTVEERDGSPCRIRMTIRDVGNSKSEARNLKQYQNSKFVKITSVEDSWRVDEEWWREKPVSRLYFEVILADGSKLTVFKELAQGKWYRQRV